MNGDVLVKNGIVMDGGGEPAFRADVLIRGERIEDVGVFPDAEAGTVIDASGLTVAPGFIDAHTHLDFLFPSPRHPQVLESWARQGVTTIVCGNCGYSPAPASEEAWKDVCTYWSFALPHDGLRRDWATMAEYFDYLEREGLGFNVAVLTGHNSIRASVFGFQARLPSANEVAAMKRLLRESLKAGSIGLSLGLYYCPGIFSDSSEVAELASVCAEFDVPLVPHTRGLTVTYDAAVKEVVQIAETNRIPLHISHHAGADLRDPGVRARALETIRQAQERGISVSHDNIPWLVGPTTALSVLPPRLFDGGVDAALRSLTDPAVRARTIAEMHHAVPQWPNWEHRYWTDKFFGVDLRFAGFRREQNRRFDNMRLGDIAKEMGRDPYETLFDLLVMEEGKLFFLGGLFDEALNDQVMGPLLQDPYCCIITDAVGADFGLRSPVSFGAFARVLGHLARDQGLMSQEEAVRKMTSLPAQRMGLKDRGALRKGAFADITVFNAETVQCRATFEDPFQFAEGIEYVLINGKVVLDGGAYRPDVLAGRVVKKR